MCADQELWQQLQSMLFQRGEQGVWGRLTHGGGAAGRPLLSLGLWLQDWYTTAFSPVPPASAQDHCHSPAPAPQAQDHCHPTAFPGTFSHPCLHPTTALSKVVTWVLGSYRVINIAAVTSMEVPSILHFFFKAAEGGVAWGERRGSTEGEKGLCK